MWDFKYKPLKKVVEARSSEKFSDILLTVSEGHTKLSMNGKVVIPSHRWEEFAVELAEAGKKARAILEAQ